MKSNKIVERIVNSLLNLLIVIFGIVLLISIYNGIQNKILKKEYADFFGYTIFEVQTGSMAKTINVGDWIVVKLTKDVKINDIITYELNKEYITHRVIAAYGNSFLTKGDANNIKDDPIKYNQIVGKVVKILPNLGILRKVFFNPTVLIALIATLLLFNYSFKKTETINKNNKKSLISKFKEKAILAKINKENKKIEENSKKEDANAPKVEKIETDDRGIYYDFSDISDEVDDESEFDKTTLFRVIPVDASEIDNTFIEIAETEIKQSDNSNEEPVEDQDDDSKEEEKSDRQTKINFDLLNENKKGKNVIDTAMIYKIEELEEIISSIVSDKTCLDKKAVKNIFISTYIDARYYNYYGGSDIDNSNKNMISKINDIINEISKELIEKYKGKDSKYKESVLLYEKLFILIASLDQAKLSITDIKIKRKFYKKEFMKYDPTWNSQKYDEIIDAVLKIQRNYIGIFEYFLKKLATNVFEINLNKLATKKNFYGVDLKHNISFSKVYSDYIIDKTYSEGIIAEDKIPILFTLLMIQLIKDMEGADFDKKYIINMPDSLFQKEKKVERFLKIISDKYAKENIVILVTLDELSNYISQIKEIRKNGYKIAVTVNKETSFEKEDINNLYIMDYIFVDKKLPNAIKMLSLVPDDILDNIIYENISDKVGELGDQS